jgi:hypothetical protein
MRNLLVINLGVLAALFLTACSAALESAISTPLPKAAEIDSQPTLTASDSPSPSDEAIASPGGINRRVDMKEDIYNPTLLPYDAIFPVYNPEFDTADQVPLDDEELVIGITLNGESKAYSITVLRSREMVNDELGGLPILVTW